MKYNNIFDSHAHYTDESFDDDRGDILSALPENGIKHIMLASADLDTSRKGVNISRKYPYIYTSVGVHPEAVERTFQNEYIGILKNLADYDKVKAIGEIGLDYHYEGYNKDLQIKFFTEQILLAQELELPVIIHSRDATADTMEVISKFNPKGVMHCFSGSAETAKELIKLGFYISFTGVLTFKNAKKAIEALKAIPMDRLLLETDCPYMAPVPFRGKRCDSSMIPYIADVVSGIKNLDVQEVLNITSRNAEELFCI